MIRMAVRSEPRLFLAAPNILKLPGQISRHKKVEFPIVVNIDKSRARRPARRGNPGSFRYIRKLTLAVVAVESIAAVARYVEIRESVVVVVAYRYAHSEGGSRQSRLHRD